MADAEQEQALVPSQAVPEGFRQRNPSQQLEVDVQPCPAVPQPPGWHVPAPVAEERSQASPSQQSAPLVHTPSCGWQVAGAPHTPSSQIIEQQTAGELQAR